MYYLIKLKNQKKKWKHAMVVTDFRAIDRDQDQNILMLKLSGEKQRALYWTKVCMYMYVYAFMHVQCTTCNVMM